MNAVLLPMIVANADEVDRQAGLRPSLASKHLVEYWCPKPKGGFFVSRRRVGQAVYLVLVDVSSSSR